MNITHQTFSKSKVQENILAIPVVFIAKIQPFENKGMIQRLLTFWICAYALGLEIKRRKLYQETLSRCMDSSSGTAILWF